jgi:diguanylate cyclase (GGDEF)-like protein/PAS domain S-box-containing protein
MSHQVETSLSILTESTDDVAERRRAGDASAESDARFRRFFAENASVMLLLEPAHGIIVAANQAAAVYYGYAQEQLIGMPIGRINPGPEAIHSDMKGESLERQTHLSLIHRIASGEERHVEVYSSSFVVDGRPLLHAIVHDVTERKRAEARLLEATERLTLATNAGRVGIFDGDLLNGVLDWDDQVLCLFGITREKFRGVPEDWENALHPEDRERVLQESNSAILGKRKFDTEYRVVWPDGSIHHIRAHGRVKRDASGKPIRLIGTNWDITAQKHSEEQLRVSEERYRTVFQTSVDGIAISHISDGRFFDVNRAFLEIVGYEHSEVVGRASLELGLWADIAAREEMVADLRAHSSFRDRETQYRKKSGERIWVQISASTMEIEGIDCILAVIRDVTATKKAEEGLATAQQARLASETRYHVVFQTSLDAINLNRFIDGSYIDVNNAFLKIVGYEREEVIGKTSHELNIWADARDRQKLLDILHKGGSCQGLEAQFKKKNGEIFWGQMSASMLEVDGVTCILSITRDISDAKLAESEIRNLAFYDTLTHLPNRRLVSERLRQTLASSGRSNRKGALLFIDLDDFKTLNDTLGHKTGDLLLQEVARRLSGCLREVDTVARLGGDEFVVILEDLSETAEEAAAQAKTVAAKILATVSQPYVLAGRDCLNTCSIGVTVFGERKDTSDDILQQADIAMYQAKAVGRNTLRFFAPALQSAINARASLEEDLRLAIGTDQFQLFYQPQVETNTLVGVEVLLRWIHPVRGMRPPGEFIPLAEETGLILPLGDWVLETACAQIATWSRHPETAHLTVAVNISARQLRQPDFVEQVLSVLHHAGANPQKLKLELTESMLVDSVEEVIAKMTLLKSHGLSFSLDDFGTGYSSLSYLKRFPLDQLKIDRAFVRDMLVDVSSGAIAQAIIALSRAMGLSVIAEGVETETECEFLTAHGCNSFQGYLFSPPVPLEEFQTLVSDWIEKAS